MQACFHARHRCTVSCMRGGLVHRMKRSCNESPSSNYRGLTRSTRSQAWDLHAAERSWESVGWPSSVVGDVRSECVLRKIQCCKHCRKHSTIIVMRRKCRPPCASPQLTAQGKLSRIVNQMFNSADPISDLPVCCARFTKRKKVAFAKCRNPSL